MVILALYSNKAKILIINRICDISSLGFFSETYVAGIRMQEFIWQYLRHMHYFYIEIEHSAICKLSECLNIIYFNVNVGSTNNLIQHSCLPEQETGYHIKKFYQTKNE